MKDGDMAVNNLPADGGAEIQFSGSPEVERLANEAAEAMREMGIECNVTNVTNHIAGEK